MKAFGIYDPNIREPGWFSKAVPQNDSFGVLLEPVACSACSSDVEGVLTSDYLDGLALGHESVGRIVAAGKDVRDFHVNDIVAVPCVTPNWRSPDIQDTVFERAGDPVCSLHRSTLRDGCFAERYFVPDADMNLALIPNGVSLEAAVMTTDMVSTGFMAAELGEVGFGDSVLVIGIGPVGLMAVVGSALRGAARITVVGHRENTKALAGFYGATDMVDYREPELAERLLEISSQRGYDVTIVAGGGTASVKTAYRVTKKGGTISNVCSLKDDDAIVVPRLYCGGGCDNKRFVCGVSKGGRRRMERLLSMIAAGRFDPSPLITHRLSGLEACGDSWRLMRDKPADLIKSIVYI